MTVLLVERNAFGALRIAGRGHVMAIGRITIEVEAADLMADSRMREA